MATNDLREAMTPGTVTTLGALRPGDVGAFVMANGIESDPFVIEDDDGDDVLRTLNSRHKVVGLVLGAPVRYLGRGRIEPARIVMEGEPTVAELEAQVRTLREAVVQAAIPLEAINGSVKWELCNALQESVSNAVATIRAALAATAPKEKP